MEVNLDRIDLINLLRGVCPSYSVIHQIPENLGTYNEPYGWTWFIDRLHPFKEYTDQELFGFYKICKDSWKSLYKNVDENE